MHEKPSFFAELKRRNVYKVAVAYGVVSWLLIQAASIFLPAFNAPQWTMQVVILILVVGFPIALAFSWAFEITSEGIKLESGIDPNKSIARRTGRKIVALTIALAIIAAGLFVYQLVRSKSDTPRQDASAARTEAAKAAPSKSIAVLPFDNLSRDPDNAYFCEGVQDEILTRLAKVGDLKVISRTSTQHFKSAPENLPEIARQLGVANILEGSVQRSGDQVRVNVQLIKADTDAHLWADIFDRKLTDIFAVESDIAKTIADTLQAKLTGSEQTAISKTPTANQQAYELYLKGRFFWNKRTGADLKKAAEFFQQAIVADPSYASAYAGLAQTQLLIPVFGIGKPPDFFPAANSAAKRAIALDETSAEGHSALAMLLLFDFKFAESEKEFQRAIEANPNYATAHHWFGNSLLVTLGRFDEGVKEGKRAVELDPLSLIINADLGSTLMIARRYDDAIAQFKRTLALDDKFAYAHWNLGEALYLKGDTKAAIAEYEKARALDDDPEILALLGRAYAETGRKGEALELLAQLQEKGKTEYVRNYLYTILYIGLGDRNTALDYLEKARDGAETPDTGWIKVDPLFDPLRGEPRFQQLVARLFSRSP
jgi:TolB-like protein/Tfp pilus assembly protein PilF